MCVCEGRLINYWHVEAWSITVLFELLYIIYRHLNIYLDINNFYFSYNTILLVTTVCNRILRNRYIGHYVQPQTFSTIWLSYIDVPSFAFYGGVSNFSVNKLIKSGSIDIPTTFCYSHSDVCKWVSHMWYGQ